MKLTKKQAKELSIKKWEYIVKSPNGIYDYGIRFPVFKKLINGCGYCEKYINTESPMFESCAKCPIRPKLKNYDNIKDVGCMQDCHPYHAWGLDSTKENAQVLLDLIKKS